MNFTRRSYRIAIKRSIREETWLTSLLGGKPYSTAELRRWWAGRYLTQVNITRKLQARKRRERK